MYSNWTKLDCKFKGQEVGVKLIGGHWGLLMTLKHEGAYKYFPLSLFFYQGKVAL